MDTTKLWRPEDAAEFMQVDVSKVHRLITAGELPAYSIGDEFRIAWEDLQSYLQRQRVGEKIAIEGHPLHLKTLALDEHNSGQPRNLRKEIDFERRALDVLRAVKVNSEKERPFLTAYEIAVKIAQELIAEGIDYDTLGIPIGGQGSGQHRSLSKMVAIYLSSRSDIAEKATRTPAEAKTVDHHGRRIKPSVSGVSAFRLKELASTDRDSL